MDWSVNPEQIRAAAPRSRKMIGAEMQK